ncbi:MAG TPA: hypothetical protein VM713_04995 [Steroidobacteraceae bacterium]|nr:hypothetical protein [Steroidobacteraceae bacterium]
MRTIYSILIVPALAAAATCAEAQNVSVNAVITGQVVPGVYGQVVIGNAPPPPVVYQQPMVVEPPPVVVGAPPDAPLYLHVPPGHAKHWNKHCREYNACDRPVYFVRSPEYEPGFDMDRWRREHGHEHHGHGHDRDDHDRGDHDRGDHDRGDHDRDHVR